MREQHSIKEEELYQISHTLENGIDRMLDFYQKLQDYDKQLLTLFIVLMLDLEQYERAMNILRKLDRM